MSSSLDSGVGETIENDSPSGDLETRSVDSLVRPVLPMLYDRSAKSPDPLFRGIEVQNGVSITRVDPDLPGSVVQIVSVQGEHGSMAESVSNVGAIGPLSRLCVNSVLNSDGIQIAGNVVVNASWSVGNIAFVGILSLGVENRMREADVFAEILSIADVVENIVGIKVSSDVILVVVVHGQDSVGLVVDSQTISEVVKLIGQRITSAEASEVGLRRNVGVGLQILVDVVNKFGNVMSSV